MCSGRVAEWSIAPVLKTGNGSHRSRVQIPPLPLQITVKCLGAWALGHSKPTQDCDTQSLQQPPKDPSRASRSQQNHPNLPASLPRSATASRLPSWLRVRLIHGLRVVCGNIGGTLETAWIPVFFFAARSLGLKNGTRPKLLRGNVLLQSY